MVCNPVWLEHEEGWGAMGDIAERFWKVQARLGLVGLVRGEGCFK